MALDIENKTKNTCVFNDLLLEKEKKSALGSSLLGLLSNTRYYQNVPVEIKKKLIDLKIEFLRFLFQFFSVFGKILVGSKLPATINFVGQQRGYRTRRLLFY